MNPLIYISRIDVTVMPALAMAELSTIEQFTTSSQSTAAANTSTEAPRFVVIGDVVRDTHTGLEWTRNDVADEDLNWAAADAACKACRIGEHDDWRLPTRAELLTLVDDTKFNPAIDSNAFPTCRSEYYWTSTERAASPADYAWFVRFLLGVGYASAVHRSVHHRVRAVRASSRQ